MLYLLPVKELLLHPLNNTFEEIGLTHKSELHLLHLHHIDWTQTIQPTETCSQ